MKTFVGHLSIFLIAISALSVNHAAEQSAQQQLAQSVAKIKHQDADYNAVIALSPGALEHAKTLDSTSLGILQGMPILVKDNIETNDLPTTAGALVLANNHTHRDAPLIAQIKQAGGVIIGKTNLSEWANFRSEKSSSGWSAVGGQTHNAFDVRRSPCGSSSGSAVAVALGYVKVAIGTETHGSIVCPATSNGVVGIKPTHGLVSGDGIVPLASSQDTAGPIANTIENAALVLSTMLKTDVENRQNIINGLRDLEQAKPLKGMKVGVLASTLGYDPRRDTLFDAALNKLKEAGVELIDDIQLEAYPEFWDDNYGLLKYEFKRDLNAYLKTLPKPHNALTLEKIIAFNQQHSDRELQHFDQGIFEASQASKMTKQQHATILKRGRETTRNALAAAFSNHKLDAIIGITGGPAWLIDHVNGDSFFGPGMAGFPAVGGNPHITVPGGKIKGLPMGISFIGKRYQDHRLAQLVYRFTQLK